MNAGSFDIEYLNKWFNKQRNDKECRKFSVRIDRYKEDYAVIGRVFDSRRAHHIEINKGSIIDGVFFVCYNVKNFWAVIT